MTTGPFRIVRNPVYAVEPYLRRVNGTAFAVYTTPRRPVPTWARFAVSGVADRRCIRSLYKAAMLPV
ncbi:hypothetical protein [Streptoalloteichus tenebrarius]|uniref:hypothetical protein n=1 Tax=Streptoalloteichus tenebrarius (strain ATCC 17920 / DSM 40477 / JCM 4838 / CBS 697.72 / NBRC 16177 / NCIMB 11028 / NRRL B-12390 / A12253. 1 / ISP 5477) TaxID=1933 RepID=UPI0020A5F2F3|nr:hypothetical protein [Streptoalloteichus tenebrarius]BFE99535.1 hypothetical protein GCM10020241_12110 [Streptoalloteichus tenebrarius]